MDRARKKLEAAYRAAWVEIELPSGRVVLPPVAAGLLRALPSALEPWGAVITAWNPRSVPLTPKENEARQEALAAALDDLGVPVFPALGRDAGSTWTEPSFAVVAPPRAELIALARRFEQNAVYLWRGRSWRVIWIPPVPSSPSQSGDGSP